MNNFFAGISKRLPVWAMATALLAAGMASARGQGIGFQLTASSYSSVLGGTVSGTVNAFAVDDIYDSLYWIDSTGEELTWYNYYTVAYIHTAYEAPTTVTVSAPGVGTILQKVIFPRSSTVAATENFNITIPANSNPGLDVTGTVSVDGYDRYYVPGDTTTWPTQNDPYDFYFQGNTQYFYNPFYTDCYYVYCDPATYTPLNSTITILNPNTVMSIGVNGSSSLTEGDVQTGTNIRISRGDSYNTRTVYYTVSGDAENGFDYVAPFTGSVAFTAGGATYVDIPVYTFANIDYASTLTVTLNYDSTNSYKIGANSSTSVTFYPAIIDDTEDIDNGDDWAIGGSQIFQQTTPSFNGITVSRAKNGSVSGTTTNAMGTSRYAFVNVQATSPYAVSQSPGVFNIMRTGGSNAFTLNYTISGTGTAGSNYVTLPGSVQFATNQTSTNLLVTVLTNSPLADAQSVVLTLGGSSNYFVGANMQAVVTLLPASSSTNSVSFPIGRYWRGSGSDPTYWSQVIPLDYQKGTVYSNSNGNCSTLYSGLSSWSSQTLYHYNAASSLAQTNTANRIGFNNPIVAFGERVGGTPLYLSQPYNFGIYGGDPLLAATQIVIQVYSRTTGLLTNSIKLVPPSYSNTNSMSRYVTNGFQVTTNAFGLSTTLSDSPGLNWGASGLGAYVLTHTATGQATNYYYLVEVFGYPADGTNAMAISSSGAVAPSLLYSLEFAARPPWRSIFLDRPQFAGSPMPPFYAGKTLAEILTNTLPVSNSVSFDPSAAKTLDNSPELRQHPILDNFVASMGNDPIALANYVLNSIDLTDPMDYSDNGNIAEQSINLGGVSRGALGTFVEKQGSPVDQCALLIYLLRQAGVSAVYEFAPRDGLKILDARLSRMLKMQVHGAFSEAGRTYTTNTMISVNYPWVAAYIGTNWVHIFPWFKDYSVVEGLNMYEYMPTNYSSAYPWVRDYIYGKSNLTSLAVNGDNTPRVIFPAFLKQTLLQNYPGISVDDLGVQILNRQHYYSRWQDFPTPTWVTNVSTPVESLTASAITNISPALTNIFDTVSVEIYSEKSPTNDIQTGDLRLVDLHNREFYVRQMLTNANKVQLSLILMPFRTNVTTQWSFTNDASLLSKEVLTMMLGTNENQLSVRFRYHRHRALSAATAIAPGLAFLGLNACQEIDLERPLWKGDRAAICMDYGRVTRDMLNVHAADIWQMENTLRLHPTWTNTISPDVYEGAVMYLAGMSYYKKVSDFNRVNQDLHKVNMLSSWAVGLSKMSPARNSYGTLTNGVDPVSPGVDMFFYETAYAGNGTVQPDSGASFDLAQQNFNLISIVNNSAEEHQIINRFYNQTNAVSTVRLLQLAQTTSTGVVPLNFNNYVAQGKATNQGKQLQKWDANLWSAVVNALNTSPYTTAYITPGPMTNKAYSGMAALILGWNQWQALITPQSLNGAEGEQLDAGSMEPNNTGNYDLADGEDFVMLLEKIVSGTELAPTMAAMLDYANVYAQILNGSLIETALDAIWSSMADRMLGLPTTGTPSQVQAAAFQGSEKQGLVGWLTDGLSQLKASASDPVQVVSGEFYIDETDLQLPGPMPLALRRNYSSQNLADNQFGSGWKLSIMPYLTVSVGNTNIYAADMDGAVLAYVRTNSSTNVWVPTLAANPRLNNNTTSGVGGLANRMRDRIVQMVNGSTTNYTLYGADGSTRAFQVMTFDNGVLAQTRPYLQSWTDNRGNYYVFTYGMDSTQPNFGQVIRIQSSNGNYLGFDFDMNSRILDSYSGDGRWMSYDYDEFGDLVTVTLPDATTRSYIYQHATQAVTNGGTAVYSTHLIIEEDKPDGRILQNVYDSQRRVTNQLSTAGTNLTPILTAKFSYSNNYTFTNSLTNRVTGYTLVVDGNNNTTRYDYTNSLITKITDPLNQTIQQTWYSDTTNSPGYPRSLFQVVDKRGLTNQFKYDSNGNVTNVLTIGDLTGDGITNATNTAQFNANSLVTNITDAVGNSMVIVYDPVFNYLPQQAIRYAGSTPISTNYTYYGNATNIIVNGSVTQTNIAMGMPTRQIRAYGSVDAATTDLGFDGHGFITNSIRYSGTSDPNITTTFFYNERGQMVSRVDALGAVTFFDYDALNRLIGQENWDESGNVLSWNLNYYNDNGELIWVDGPRFNPEDYVFFDYDGEGRRTTEIHWRAQGKADGSGVEAPAGYAQYAQSFYQYDPVGNLILAVNPRGAITTNTWDALGRLARSQRLDTNGTTVLSTNAFGYEPGGQVKYYTNALGGITTNFYTTNGIVKYQGRPDGSTNGWRYYLDGRIKTETQGNGAYWKTTYDDVNLITTRIFYSAAGVAEATNSVQLDRRGNVIQRVDAAQSTFTSTYDGLDRISSSSGPAISTVTFVNNIGSGMPAPGDGSYVTNTVQQTTSYSYDSRGLLSTVSNALGEKTVTTHDALGRVLTTKTYAAGSVTPLRTTSYTYSADHHSVTVTEGTGANAISSTNYTDNDGRTVLTTQSPASGQLDYSLNTYDLAGNRIESDQVSSAGGQPYTWSFSQWSYDGLNRVRTETSRDNAVTVYSYDLMGNLTNRAMPGNLSWSGTYSNSGQILTEKNINGSQVTRNSTYTYYPAGNVWAGMLKTVTDGRGVAQTTAYDDWLRAASLTSTGTNLEQQMSASWQYDPRGLLTNITQSFSNSATGPTTIIGRVFDSYGQLVSESVSLGGVVSSVSESWNGIGRRSRLSTGTWSIGYQYQADGQMTGVNGAFFGYADNGLLTGRSNSFRTNTIIQRDLEGRPTLAATYAGVQVSTESWGWLGDGSPYTYTSPRSDYTDTRNFAYGSLHRRMTNETLNLGASQSMTNVYGFDGGASAGLGVLTQVGPSPSQAQWSAGVDSFSRVNADTNSVIHRTAKGTINGVAALRGYLNGRSVDLRYDTHAAGQWTADMGLVSGTNMLTVYADRPITNNFVYTIGCTNVFTVDAGSADRQTNQYDGIGNVTNRVWKDANGQVVKTQTLRWDAFNRLVQVTERDTNNNGFNYQADFDALGRQLRTTETTVSNNIALSSQPSPVVINFTYDPAVAYEFVGIKVTQGTRSRQDWLTYGPDISGRYGGMQGVGGLETITSTDTGGSAVTVGVISDSFGNVLAGITNGVVVTNASRVSLYGPVEGYAPPRIALGVPLYQNLAYRTRLLTAYSTVTLGLRQYDFKNRCFLSFDPAWNGGDPNGFSAFGGNPAMYFDPRGMCIEGLRAGWNSGGSPRDSSGIYDAAFAGAEIIHGYYEGMGTGVENIGIGAWDATKGTAQTAWHLVENQITGDLTAAFLNDAYNLATSDDARSSAWNGIKTYATDTFTDTDKFSQRIGGNGLLTLLTLGLGEWADSLSVGCVSVETDIADGPGAMSRLQYENNPKHGPVQQGAASPAPLDGQAALDSAVSFSENSTGKISLDSDGMPVVLRQTSDGVYHGYRVPFNDLTAPQKNALIWWGFVNRKGVPLP